MSSPRRHAEEREYLFGEVRHLMAYKIPAWEVAARLNTTAASLARLGHRWQQRDIARYMDDRVRLERTCADCGEPCTARGEDVARCRPCYRYARRTGVAA